MAKNEKTGPFVKNHVGRFQVSIWRNKKIIPAKNEYIPEREVDVIRACIQYGRFNRATGSWENQSIWCNPEELRDLANVLDKLNENNGSGNASRTKNKAQ